MQSPILLVGEQKLPAAAAESAAVQLDTHDPSSQPFAPTSYLPHWVSNDRKVSRNELYQRLHPAASAACAVLIGWLLHLLARAAQSTEEKRSCTGLSSSTFQRPVVHDCRLVQVLRWFGFFREQVTESRVEADKRVRRIVVHFYVEDDTLDICEPRQDDSGLLQVRISHSAATFPARLCHHKVSLCSCHLTTAAAYADHTRHETSGVVQSGLESVAIFTSVSSMSWQGMLIKRHKPQKGPSSSFAPADFLVGGSFTMYARTFHLGAHPAQKGMSTWVWRPTSTKVLIGHHYMAVYSCIPHLHSLVGCWAQVSIFQNSKNLVDPT